MQGRTLQAESDTRGTVEQVQASPDEAAVGRIVAAAVATVIANDDAERKWAAEIAMLRQRIQRSAMMEAVAERRQLQEQQTEVAFAESQLQVTVRFQSCLLTISSSTISALQQAMSRRLQQVGMAVALAGLGAAAAVYLLRGMSK